MSGAPCQSGGVGGGVGGCYLKCFCILPWKSAYACLQQLNSVDGKYWETILTHTCTTELLAFKTEAQTAHNPLNKIPLWVQRTNQRELHYEYLRCKVPCDNHQGIFNMKFLYSGMQKLCFPIICNCPSLATQSLFQGRSSFNKICPYTARKFSQNWGLALFQEWVLFCETMHTWPFTVT